MASLTILTGNVGKDPDVIDFDWGKVAKFSFATSESWKNKEGEKVTETSWHNIVIKTKLSNIVEKYVHKGDKLLLQGRIAYRQYEDKEGNTKYITEINCFSMEMLGSKPKEEAKPDKAEHPHSDPAELDRDYVPPPDATDLPF